MAYDPESVETCDKYIEDKDRPCRAPAVRGDYCVVHDPDLHSNTKFGRCGSRIYGTYRRCKKHAIGPHGYCRVHDGHFISAMRESSPTHGGTSNIETIIFTIEPDWLVEKVEDLGYDYDKIQCGNVPDEIEMWAKVWKMYQAQLNGYPKTANERVFEPVMEFLNEQSTDTEIV